MGISYTSLVFTTNDIDILLANPEPGKYGLTVHPLDFEHSVLCRSEVEELHKAIGNLLKTWREDEPDDADEWRRNFRRSLAERIRNGPWE